MSDDIRPGNKFELRVTENMSPDNVWIEIPHWFAGTWIIEEETVTYHKDYTHDKEESPMSWFPAKSKFSYGQQTDKEGEVWHYSGTPYWSSTDFPNFTEYHLVDKKEMTGEADGYVAFKTQLTVVRVSKSNREINRTYQQEGLTAYRLKPDGQLEMASSTKIFDDRGEPTDLVHNHAVAHKADPYRQADWERGRDLKQLFREFLSARGLTNLLPDETKSTQ